jgi:hypothetical protein
MNAAKIGIVISIGMLGLWAMIQGELNAQEQPVPAQPAPAMTLQQATQNLSGIVSGFLTYAPTTDAQRKLAVDSYNIVKAEMDKLIAAQTPQAAP